MSSDVFHLHGIAQAYGGKEVLVMDDLTIKQGEVFCMLGPSGAGKSTFLRLLNLIEPPSRGYMEFLGKRIDYGRNLIANRRRMAMVFQDSLLFNTTVANNIAYGLKVRKMAKKSMEKKVVEAAKMVGVEPLLSRHARDISGGEAQRVSLARALAVEPKVLLLDEPFASLDTPAKNRLRREFMHLVRSTDLTAILVTHDQDVALDLADTVTVLNDGRIEQMNTPEDIYMRPRTGFVAGFLGVENIFTGTVRDTKDGLATIEAGGNVVEAVGDFRSGCLVECFLRAEDISLEADGGAHGSVRNRWVGRVVKIARMRGRAYVTIDCGIDLVVAITSRSLEDMDIEIGKAVTAAFKAVAVAVAVKNDGDTREGL